MAASEELKRKADQLASIFGPAELPKSAKLRFKLITKAERAPHIKSEEIDHTPRAIDKKSDFFSLGQTFLIEPLPPLGQPEFLNALPDRQAACVLFGLQT